MKLKLYKTIFTILIILLLVVTSLILIKYGKSYENEKENRKVIEIFSREIGDRRKFWRNRNEWV